MIIIHIIDINKRYLLDSSRRIQVLMRHRSAFSKSTGSVRLSVGKTIKLETNLSFKKPIKKTVKSIFQKKFGNFRASSK